MLQHLCMIIITFTMTCLHFLVLSLSHCADPNHPLLTTGDGTLQVNRLLYNTAIRHIANIGETSVFAVLPFYALSIFQTADNPHSASSSHSFLEVSENDFGKSWKSQTEQKTLSQTYSWNLLSAVL